ncbi:hypothetical protein [Serratia fonticola]|uniref:hypothetical protein n=1 Tax=Serratia fonticola TaxID=47917 RepID=UPI0021BA97BE|nr:hypothetical protein [Serratia fonticola]
MKNRFLLLRHIGLWLLALLFSPRYAGAETITIGKGSGVQWEGLPFNVTLEGPLESENYQGGDPIAGLSSLPERCTTGFFDSIRLAPGVKLTLRATINGYFTRYDNSRATFSGTVGLPSTDVRMDNGMDMRANDSSLCFESEKSGFISKYYSPTGPRAVNFSGTWIIVTDGSQQPTYNVTVPSYYAISNSYTNSGKRNALISPSRLSLRISTLECTVQTQAQINFGPLANDPTVGAELGRLTYPLNVNCSQASDRIKANINVQLRALSGHYQGAPTKLALQEGGGYITGEIDNGVTGSGSCTATSGVPFNNTAIKISTIASSQSSMATTNQITWRLCSGGPSLPMGNVNAAAEMLVTFN